MRFDPSNATTSCNVCGTVIEAWIQTCDDCDYKIIENAQNKMDINYPNSWLEAYDRSDKKVILKVSSPNAEFDYMAAQKMRAFFKENNIPYEDDKECGLKRTIWISQEDFNTLFVNELKKEV